MKSILSILLLAIAVYIWYCVIDFQIKYNAVSDKRDAAQDSMIKYLQEDNYIKAEYFISISRQYGLKENKIIKRQRERLPFLKLFNLK